jgi:hypothetical protein
MCCLRLAISNLDAMLDNVVKGFFHVCSGLFDIPSALKHKIADCITIWSKQAGSCIQFKDTQGSLVEVCHCDMKYLCECHVFTFAANSPSLSYVALDEEIVLCMVDCLSRIYCTKVLIVNY